MGVCPFVTVCEDDTEGGGAGFACAAMIGRGADGGAAAEATWTGRARVRPDESTWYATMPRATATKPLLTQGLRSRLIPRAPFPPRDSKPASLAEASWFRQSPSVPPGQPAFPGWKDGGSNGAGAGRETGSPRRRARRRWKPWWE